MNKINEQKRAWTQTEIHNMGIDVTSFEIPKDPTGEVYATLVTRAWPKKANFRKSLLCYFVADDGSKFFLLAFQDLKSGLYKPRETEMDFTTVEVGARFKLTYKSNKGLPNWITAEAL